MVAAKRLRSMLRSAQHSACLPRESSDRGVRRYLPATRYLVSDVAHSAPSDAGHGPQQMPRLWVPVKCLCHCSNAPRELRRGSGERFGDFRKSFLRHRRNRLGHHRKKLAGGHPDQRQEMLGGLIFGFRFRRQLTQMFHHGVWIDLADGANLVLVLLFALVFVLAFPEQAAGDVAQGAEPAFAFRHTLVLHFAFHLVLELVFKFTFQLVCHDESSWVIGRTYLDAAWFNAKCSAGGALRCCGALGADACTHY
jgi:hypothetical protein